MRAVQLLPVFAILASAAPQARPQGLAEALAREGVNSSGHPGQVHVAAAIAGNQISQNGWTAFAYSVQAGNEASLAIDGNSNTFWHSEYSPTNAALPHSFTIDMKQQYNIAGLSYLPRQDGNKHGNIGQHQISVSVDGNNFGSPVAFGTFLDDQTQKNVSFEPVPARYVRINALSEAGNRGPWSSAAEFNIYSAYSYNPPGNNIGKWGPTINFPIVPVQAALEPNTGRVLTWSSYSASTFTGGNGGDTVTATFDPATNIVSQRTVTNTDHDMFCPGISIDATGRPIVTGGNDASKTSIYNSFQDTWVAGSQMSIARGYQSSTICSDGRMFTIGGSWSGGYGNKNGEIYDPSADTWTLLPGCPVAPMLTNDQQGIFRQDNHGWLFGWKGQSVFQAGPSKAMNWYATGGNGGQSGAGNRASDDNSMCGNAVMYDAVAGKILTLGGSPDYQGSSASSAAHIITIGNAGSTPNVQTLSSMSYQRIFANAVILPNGNVFVTGGQVVGNPFYDTTADLTPEMWHQSTETFSELAPNSIPRTYHSVALLLLDGTVLSGGGGLCGDCTTNHFDAQIFTPPYLLTGSGAPATRPVITSLSASTVRVGGSLTVQTDSGAASMALVRYGSATHTVDTDQRRIPLTPRSTGTNTYSFTIPNDSGIAIPGYWMLFVFNSAQVPSIAQTVLITT